MKILIWNTWYRVHPEVTLRAIACLNCDILLLQEVRLDAWSKNYYSLPEQIYDLGYASHMFECRAFNGYREGSGIFSRWNLTAKRSVELRTGGRAPLRGGALSRRMYLEATIGLPRREALTVGLAHLSYPLPFGIGREYRAVELEKLCIEIKKPKQNFILGGDLNAVPMSSKIEKISRVLKHLGPDFSEKSWLPARSPWFARRLDYAFGTGDIAAKAYLAPIQSSDHRPLIVELDL